MKAKVFVLPLLLAATLALTACSPQQPAGKTTVAPENKGTGAEPADKGKTAPDVKPAASDAVDIVRLGDDLPGPLTRKTSEKVVVNLETNELNGWITDDNTYEYWTYGGKVPGPFIRVREGDTVEFHLTNDKNSKFPHSIDLHSVSGPGGGGAVTQTNPGEESVFTWKALNPGLYVYHCATADIPTHVTKGMYGLVLVEPKEGLAPVDKEFYVMQGDFYAKGTPGQKGHLEFDAEAMDMEHPRFVTFNGKVLGLTGDNTMKAKVGDRVRIYVGVGGANLSSSFHVIGEIFDVLHPEGSTDAVRNVQTTMIPPGGAAWVEFTIDVPGTYILVDHSLSRALHKGAVATIVAEGDEKPEIFKQGS